MKDYTLSLGIGLVIMLIFIVGLIVYAMKHYQKGKVIIEYDTKRAQQAVMETTVGLLLSASKASCCSNQSYRDYKVALKNGQYLFKPAVKKKLDAYACVFYEQLVLYPLRKELLNVKVNARAKDIVGIHREQPINTYYDYQVRVMAYAEEELKHIKTLFGSASNHLDDGIKQAD